MLHRDTKFPMVLGGKTKGGQVTFKTKLIFWIKYLLLSPPAQQFSTLQVKQCLCGNI